MKYHGLSEYFQGYNIIDFSQYVLFQAFYFSDTILPKIGMDPKSSSSIELIKEIKLIIQIMAFFKLMYFVRIYENYGYLW